MLSGLTLLLYPTLSDFINNVSRAKDINTYAESVSEIDSEEYQKMWDAAVDYNTRLARMPAHWKLTDDEMKEYYKTLNDSIIADLGLTDSYDLSYSEYGVAIQYRYYL